MLFSIKRRKSMEELLYKLEAIILIRKAIAQTYNEIKNSDKLIECVSFIDDIEELIVSEYSTKVGSL
jgi:hypothetical protein